MARDCVQRVLVAAAALAASGVVASDPPTKPLAALVQSNIEAEWAAFRSRDKTAYADLLASDFRGVEIDSQGTRDKSQAVHEIERGLVSDYTLSRIKVSALGPEAALATYEAFIQFPSTAQIRSVRVYVSEVWVLRAGQWKALHYQETRVK
jgi:hypothetical protein